MLSQMALRQQVKEICIFPQIQPWGCNCYSWLWVTKFCHKYLPLAISTNFQNPETITVGAFLRRPNLWKAASSVFELLWGGSWASSSLVRNDFQAKYPATKPERNTSMMRKGHMVFTSKLVSFWNVGIPPPQSKSVNHSEIKCPLESLKIDQCQNRSIRYRVILILR